MKKLALTLALMGGLASCSNLEKVYNTVSNFSVPRPQVAAGITAFNIAKQSATNYIIYCTPNPKPVGCDVDFIRNKLQPAVTKGTAVRNELSSYLRNNPNALGPKGTYDALIAYTNTLEETPK